MPAVYRTTRIVEFSDTDMAGIVHFARFFNWMESAEHALLRSLGLSVVMDWEGEKIGFPRVAASCEFLRPVRFEDELTVTAAVEKVGRTSVTYAFEFAKGEERIAAGKITTVFSQVGSSRPLKAVPIPDAIRAKLMQ